MVFLNCNLDTGGESYGLENTGISCNSGIPEAQTFPTRFPGNGNLPGISRPWFPIEHPWDMNTAPFLLSWTFTAKLVTKRAFEIKNKGFLVYSTA